MAYNVGIFNILVHLYSSSIDHNCHSWKKRWILRSRLLFTKPHETSKNGHKTDFNWLYYMYSGMF